MTDHETLAKLKKRTVFGPHLRSKFNGKIHYFVIHQIGLLPKFGAGFRRCADTRYEKSGQFLVRTQSSKICQIPRFFGGMSGALNFGIPDEREEGILR